MKTWSLCILSLLLGLSLGQIDYDTQATFSVCTTAPSGHLKSPIIIENTLCGPYGTFEVTLPSASGTAATFEQTYGAHSLAYTSGKLTYNGTTYTSQNILLRYKSENYLVSAGDAEIQIIMEGPGSSNAVLSLIVQSDANSKGNEYAYTKSPIIQSLDPATLNLNLELLQEQIMEKPKEDQFLNMFRYEGTLTYPTSGACAPAVWYVYGRPLIAKSADIDQLKAAIQSDGAGKVTLPSSGENVRTVSGQYGGSGQQAVERLCYSGYFTNYLGENYGLWFGIVIILLFFIATLFMSDIPISNPEYVESVKTIHPLYSIWTVGNEIFTKKSRSALVLMTLTMHALFSSTWYRQSGHRTRGSNIIVYAIYSMLISWAYTYMLGNILRGYYTAKYHYCKTRDEAWNQKAQNRIFAYYVAVFATICIAWPFTVWNMQELLPQVDPKSSNYWVATFFVGLGLEFLVADILCALLSKSSNFLKNLSRRKGYMYDNMCHETYLNALKMD